MTKGAHSKGKAKEREFCEWIEAAMPGVEAWTPPMGKFLSNDIFGVWDVVLINKDYSGVVFIQICHPNSVKSHKERINEWMKGRVWDSLGMLVTYRKGVWEAVEQW